MSPFHFCLSAARNLSSFQLLPASLTTDLLQLFFGLPLFLFPWGFQSSAAFGASPSSFLNVWPIHLNFLFLISKTLFFPLLKIVPVMRYCGKIYYSRRGHGWQYSACAFHTGHLKLQTYTLGIRNTYCFSTATMTARTRVNVTLYVHCLSCSYSSNVHHLAKILLGLLIGLVKMAPCITYHRVS